MGHPAVEALVAELAQLHWVRDVWLHGSLATGDHRADVSDIDLVAITTRPPDPSEVRRLHRAIDVAWVGSALGCAYVDTAQVPRLEASHPTWTHGRLIERRLSLMVRAELLDHGRVLLGRQPALVLGPMSPTDVREAAGQELNGYWSWALRRPWLFLRPPLADLALLSMARARLTLSTGSLVSKDDALAHVRAPRRVVDGLRRRRTSPSRTWPVSPVLAHHAWHDTRRTIAEHSTAP